MTAFSDRFIEYCITLNFMVNFRKLYLGLHVILVELNCCIRNVVLFYLGNALAIIVNILFT